ncbi:UDP-glucosyltransferase 2-like [Euwallacea fornicatus]|uniref:UDP-glucosyltransferase 2-like n=1 Tax=Euwallacea fornicatus TaxID=995702 RepID=UPI00338D86F6
MHNANLRGKVLICVTILAIQCHVVLCSKILVVLPSPGYSQHILMEPLIMALSMRGHNVTVISGFAVKDPSNVRNIVVDFDKVDITPNDLFELRNLDLFTNIRILHHLGLSVTEQLLANRQVQKLIHSGEKFDLVAVETFFNEAHHAFAKHFDAHQVLLHSIGIIEWNSHMVANPNLPSYLPTSFSGYTTKMTFKERFRNTIALWFDRFYKFYVNYPAHQRLVDQYFPAKYDLEELVYNSSLMLSCSHLSSTEPQPLTSAIIEVGGMHIVNKKLPEDLKELLDSAKEGVILFSLGSNAKSSMLSKELIGTIITSIGKLDQKVLWTFDDDKIKDAPANLRISKWFPQTDILAHPNTVLFVSHCGMGSTTEAIHFGVPVICMPIFGDQFMNSKRLALFGMGLELPWESITGDAFGESVRHALSDYRFKENAKKRSEIFRDRPMGPLDLAVYWVDYVLRHNGARHLRNSIYELKWYQLYSVDVILVLVLVFVGCIYGLSATVNLVVAKGKKRKVE